mgnify:CR=1 FL=1
MENNTFNLEDKDAVAQLRDVRKTDSALINTDEDLNDEMYLKLLGVDRNWELDPQRLVITNEKLGGGEFGVVKKGIYTRKDGKDMIVAVKQLKGRLTKCEGVFFFQLYFIQQNLKLFLSWLANIEELIAASQTLHKII